MGASELLEKIRLDGRERVREIETQSERKLAELAEQRDKELAELKQEFAERIEQARRLILDRARSHAALEKRKRLLAARWQVIDRVLAQAGRKLPDDPDYPELLVELAERYAGNGAEVRLSSADAGKHADRLKVKTGEPADISGGLLVVSGRQVTDCSLDELLSARRGELAALVINELFPEEKQ